MPTDARFLHLDLNGEVARLERDPAWTNGHVAKTLVREDALRVVLIALQANGRIAEHQTDGEISIQPLHGRIRVGVAGEGVEVAAGALLVVEAGVRHDVHALEDSAFLLTIARRRA